MYQLMIFSYNEKYFEDIMMALTASGLKHTVVVEGLNMENVLAYDVPIFAGLRTSEHLSPKYCKVIYSLVEEESLIDDVVADLENAGIDNKQKTIYRIVYYPVSVKV